MEKEAWMTARVFTTWLTKCFKLTVENDRSEINIPFKMLPFVYDAHSQPRALMEMDHEINVVPMPANRTSILSSIDQGVILTFDFYDLRNIFHKARVAIDSDCSNGSGKIK